MDLVDESGHRSGTGPITFQVIIGQQFSSSAITTDGTLPNPADGTGYKPYQGSSHTYSVDGGAVASGFSYTWTVLDNTNATLIPGNSNTYSINTANPAAVVINWGNAIPLAGNNYKVKVRKQNTSTGCYIDQILDITILQNTFNATVLDYGDQCQHGETGTMIATWTVTKTGGANDWHFDYVIKDINNNVVTGSTVWVSGSTKNVDFNVTNEAGVYKT